jgi:DNA-binding transcriptional ArsR family regulator
MEKSRRPGRRKPAAPRKAQPGDPQALNAGFVTALNHPLRRELLKIYLERDAPLSPKELSKLTGKKLPTISYHVRVLADMNTLELTEEEPVRGSVAHFYEPTVHTKETPWVLESLEVRS